MYPLGQLVVQLSESAIKKKPDWQIVHSTSKELLKIQVWHPTTILQSVHEEEEGDT